MLDEYQKHVRPNQIMSFYCVVMLANGFLMAYSLTYMQNYQTNYILIISKIIRLITAMLGCVGVDIKLLFLGFRVVPNAKQDSQSIMSMNFIILKLIFYVLKFNMSSSNSDG